MRTIHRGTTRKNFTIIPNQIIQNLSNEAIGLIVLMLSKPDNWVFHRKPLCKEAGFGLNKMDRIYKELREAGYLKTVPIKENGRFKEHVIILTDTPGNFDGSEHFVQSIQNSSNSKDEPDPHAPDHHTHDFHESGNQTLINKDQKRNNIQTPPPTPPTGGNENFSSFFDEDEEIDNIFTPPSEPAPFTETGRTKFDEFWKLYPKKKHKERAIMAFKNALAIISFDDLMDATDSLAEITKYEQTDPEYIPTAANWLRGRRWEEHQDDSEIKESDVPIGARKFTVKAEDGEIITAFSGHTDHIFEQRKDGSSFMFLPMKVDREQVTHLIRMNMVARPEAIYIFKKDRFKTALHLPENYDARHKRVFVGMKPQSKNGAAHDQHPF